MTPTQLKPAHAEQVEQLTPDQVLGINDVFNTTAGVTFRLLHTEPELNIAHVIELTGKNPLPAQWELDKLVAAVRERLYAKRLVQGLAVALNDPSDTDKEHGARRFSYIKPLIATTSIFYARGRGRLIRKHAQALGVSEQTVMTALRDYWLGGQTQDALLTGYSAGARKRALTLTKQASSIVAQSSTAPAAQPAETAAAPPRSRGRKRDDKTGSYVLLGEERVLLQEAIVEAFLVKKTVTRKKLYRKVMTERYSYVDEKLQAKLLPSHARPSRKQVTTLLNNALKLRDKVIHHTSKAEWENNSRPITGTFLQHAIGVGHVYEIDSTIVDLWLVARDNRSKIIGKATLYLVVDRYSRLIVGFHITLDKPSWAGAMEALLSLVADKKDLCARYAATYRPEVWVADGILPHVVAADRGSEYLGHESDQLVEDVRVNIANMPAHMSCLKGMVECTFKLVHVSLKENAPGYEPPSNAFKRHSDKCYERDAQYTLDELAAEFIDILGLHNLRIHSGMELDPELVLQEVPPIPARVWAADIIRRSGMLRTYDESFMRHKLLPRKSAVVMQQGIYVNKCYYVCPEAFEDEWFVRAGKARFKVQVTYDRRSVNQIFIHNPERGPTPYPATLSPRSQDYTNYSVGEVYAVEGERKKMRKLAEEHNLQLEVAHEHKSAARAERARVETTKALVQAAGQSRRTGGPELRRGETGARNAKDAFAQPSVAKAAGTMPPTSQTPAIRKGLPKNAEPVAPVLKPVPTASRRGSGQPQVSTRPQPDAASRTQLLNDLFNAADD